MSLALVQHIPHAAGIPFVKGRIAAFVLSTVLMIGSIGAYFVNGLNFGIDFTGGISIEIQTEEAADLGLIRELAGGLDLGAVEVQNFGSDTEVLIRVQAQEGEGLEAEEAQQAARERLQTALDDNYPGGVEYRSVEVLGAKVSGELQRAGALAVGVALLLMLIYIWFRFEWQYSVGAILALVHDVILTIGMFAVTQLEFNLSTIAAILTIVGYSMNDTVVVYDRIRENIRKFRKMELAELLNLSINDTLSRTILTSMTTLVALFALWAIGGAALQGFAFAMIFGVAVGTYSSIFVAAPILMVTKVARESSD
ncbi:protein translocase subunit SecF [Hyphobacterium marinum]|uniref:Protein-export membrane protein SecF n=1 Tax=Hyphobacterium marinum TaxID=3116574 RepID=A0ABU7M1D6_9PROT|nr:protein translocase subunit SecF [Hyphobacterium sp. Y6023]MEE2567633.1 protein translocase subunit SecF [Hyphobacterium sp. Y6023]